MRCDKCGNDAVIYQRYSGLHLCKRHFLYDFEAKAKRAIRRHDWLCRNDHIAVVLDGDPAGFPLLHFLSELTGRRRDVTMSAVIVDDGDTGSFAGCSSSHTCAQSLNVPIITASFFGEFGISPAGTERDGHLDSPSMHLLKRALIYKTARRYGVTKLASAENLDNEACMVLEQVLRGDFESLLRLPQEPVAQPVIIRPFMYAPRNEVGLYSRLVTGYAVPGTGARETDAFTTDARNFLEAYTRRHPSTPFSLASLHEQLAGAGMPARGDVRMCTQCGGTCCDTCDDCRIIDEVMCHAR